MLHGLVSANNHNMQAIHTAWHEADEERMKTRRSPEIFVRASKIQFYRFYIKDESSNADDYSTSQLAV